MKAHTSTTVTYCMFETVGYLYFIKSKNIVLESLIEKHSIICIEEQFPIQLENDDDGLSSMKSGQQMLPFARFIVSLYLRSSSNPL